MKRENVNRAKEIADLLASTENRLKQLESCKRFYLEVRDNDDSRSFYFFSDDLETKMLKLYHIDNLKAHKAKLEAELEAL